MRFVVFDRIRHFALVTQSRAIDKGETADPVAIACIAETLYVVLLAREVPHEVSPVHEAKLVRKEPFKIIRVSRRFIFPRLLVLAKSQPLCIEGGVELVIARIPHTR